VGQHPCLPIGRGFRSRLIARRELQPINRPINTSAVFHSRHPHFRWDSPSTVPVAFNGSRIPPSRGDERGRIRDAPGVGLRRIPQVPCRKGRFVGPEATEPNSFAGPYVGRILLGLPSPGNGFFRPETDVPERVRRRSSAFDCRVPGTMLATICSQNAARTDGRAAASATALTMR